MEESKNYEAQGFAFEFSPDGGPLVGTLVTEYPEHEPYVDHVALAKSRSRKGYAKTAAEHNGVDEKLLNRALNDLCSLRMDGVRAAREAEENGGPLEPEPEVDQEEIDGLVGRAGVLERFVEDAAACSGVIGERDLLKLLALVAVSAQLDAMPNGTPLGVNVMLTGPAGRGKNRVCDAIARLLPEPFCYTFESSSAKAMYYGAANDPAFLKHRWMYPNEAEGVDLLVEMLRPLLSGGKARHRTVNKDESGRNVVQELDLEGPVSTTIPTIRNKLDKQLGTRMLIAALEDYPGRVAAHSRAVSDQLSAEQGGADHAPLIAAWRAALRSLTGVRRVVLPRQHPDFCFDSDEVSHGARLWTNVLGLMCAHAWLEQRSRREEVLGSGERAVVAEAEDYEAAYSVFAAVCERSVLNISDTHRKILDAVHKLHEDEDLERNYPPDWSMDATPVPQRKIAEESGVPQSTVSDNKSFLVHSLKLLDEHRGGLTLAQGADPSWWEKGDALDGFPRPDQVKSWWGRQDAVDGDYVDEWGDGGGSEG